jgi:predicted RNase H-like HicB family nuclease
MAQKVQSVGGTLRIHLSSDGRVSIEAKFHGFLFQEADTWVSVCPASDLSTCGATQTQALERTREAIHLFFDSCLAHGKLDQALEELKWRKEPTIAVDGFFHRSKTIPAHLPGLQVSNINLHGSVWTGSATVSQ